VTTTVDRLQGELSAIFGVPRRYHEFWAWSTDAGPGVEVHLYAHCPASADSCDLWIIDPAVQAGPQLFAQITSADQVERTIARLRLIVDERKPAQPPPTRTAAVRRHWQYLRAGRRRPDQG
jgi:hypothetical protein